mgnify:CR=1 FL=1
MTTLEYEARRETPGPVALVRRLYRAARVLVHIGAGWMLALGLGAFHRPRRRIVRRVTRQWLLTTLSILGVRVKVTGAPARGPALLVSNHVSWLDIPVLGARQELMFLAKDEVRHWPLIGPLAAAAGTLFLRRGRREAGYRRDEIAHYLRRGRTVLVFPEGTTTDGRSVAPFHGRLLGAAAQANVAVQPVTVRYCTQSGRADPSVAFVGEDDFLPHLWRLLARRRIHVRVTFHEPIPASAMDPEALARQARARVADAL